MKIVIHATGETINFNWYNNNHNLVEVYTKYNFDNCQVTIYDYLFHNTLHDISYKNTVMKDNNINYIIIIRIIIGNNKCHWTTRSKT